jgi:hypothetical protein
VLHGILEIGRQLSAEVLEVLETDELVNAVKRLV